MDKILICAIAKMEELYIREWIDWHKNIGIDHIIIGDNNDSNYNKPLQPIIQDYIDENYVELINLNDKLGYQQQFYREIYIAQKNNYDWIGFIDIDEFIELPKFDNIHDFLSQSKFNKTDSIIFCWKNFGDNGHLYYENKPVKERFTTPKITAKIGIKYFIRGHLDDVIYPISIHNPENAQTINNFKIKVCDVLGNFKFQRIFTENNKYTRILINLKYYEVGYISHYITKSTEEYIKYRCLRGRCDKQSNNYKIRHNKKHYFVINTFTEDKQKLFDKYNDQIKLFELEQFEKYNTNYDEGE